MIEIRIHGRGGQGAVTFATLLAKAVGYGGKWSQAFSAFGPERRGAPVKAFCRIDNNQIMIRSQVYNPDYVIILDPSLAELPEVSDGLKPESVIIINSPKRAFKLKNKTHLYNATNLALRVLGKDIVNTVMLGFFAKITKLVEVQDILKALDEIFKGKILELNKELVKQAYG